MISKFVCSTNIYIFVFLSVDEIHQKFMIDVYRIAFQKIKNVLVFFDEMNYDIQFSFVRIVIALRDIECNAIIKNKFHFIFLQLTNVNIFIIC